MQFVKYLHCWLFQLGQNTRSVQNYIWLRGRKKSYNGLANVFHLPLSTVPTVQMAGQSQAITAIGNVPYLWGLPGTTFTFPLCIQSVLLCEQALGIQWGTWRINDTSAAAGIKPVTFQLGTEPASPPGPCAPSGEMFFDHSCMLATERLP